MLDRRLNAFRPDLADIRLKGQVEAERFVEGTPASVCVPFAPLRPRPDFEASIDTQMLFGETLQVFDSVDGWAFVQSDVDGYVGYLTEEEITDAMDPASGLLVDLKSTSDANLEAIRKDVARRLYHGQLAFYRRCLQAAGHPAAPCVLLFVESTPPHGVRAPKPWWI